MSKELVNVSLNREEWHIIQSYLEYCSEEWPIDVKLSNIILEMDRQLKYGNV